MKVFELLPKPLGNIFRKLTHFTCNSPGAAKYLRQIGRGEDPLERGTGGLHAAAATTVRVSPAASKSAPRRDFALADFGLYAPRRLRAWA